MTLLERLQRLSKQQAMPFYTYSASQLHHTGLLERTRQTLMHYGLPGSCSPYLTFHDYKNEPIPTVPERFTLGPSWSIEDRLVLDKYLVLGFNGSGDPICLDLANDNRLVFLNHDCDFQPLLINSSVHQFLECLLLVEEAREQAGRAEMEPLMARLRVIDAACVTKGELWHHELADLMDPGQ